MIEARVGLRAHRSRQLANRDRPAPAQAQRLNGLEAAAGARQANDDRDVFPRPRIVQQAGDLARTRHADHRRHGGRCQPGGGGLLAIHHQRHLRLWLLDVPVRIHHAGRLFEDRLDLRGHFHAPACIRSVDLGHEGLQHGWSRRHLGHL